ncbi:AAA family ATPase, partial [Bartonella apis]
MVEKTGGRAAKVSVRQLRLTNYRNYRSFSADFSDGLVVFTGHNGAGKTNLLEALSFLSPGRGLRRAAYDNVIRSNPVLGSAYGNAVNQREDESLETFEKSGKQETVDSETAIAGLNSPINEVEDSGFVVFAQLHSALYGDASIGTASDIGSTGRRIRINGESVASDRLTDYCRISWLVPSMDGLFTGPAADRRRFLDRMVLAIDPAHARR